MSETLSAFLESVAATNQWGAIIPEISLGLLALTLLLIEMILPAKQRHLITQFAIFGQLAILGVLAFAARQVPLVTDQPLFGGMLIQSDLTQVMRTFFFLSALLVCYIGSIYIRKNNLPRTEFYSIVLIVAAAMMLLIQSNHFVMLFVALETVTVGFYILVAYCRRSVFSLEAGLKYLIQGALSSGILLFGIVLLYGMAGNPELRGFTHDGLAFGDLTAFIALNSDNGLLRAGVLLTLAGVLFKIGAVPFQIWVPDVYQGAPTPVTAFLAVASKAAGFLVLIILLTGPFIGMADFLVPVLSVIAGVTILFGNISAVTQRNIKRMLGFSGISHAGYLLVGVIAALQVEWAVMAVVFYLFTYLLASFAVFGVLTVANQRETSFEELEHFQEFARSQPFLGGVLAIGLGSLAGIPPLAGFVAKLFLFVAAYQAGLFWLLGISVLGVVISIYYYFGWIREIYFRNDLASPEDKPLAAGIRIAFADRVTFGALVIGTVIIGLAPRVFPILP